MLKESDLRIGNWVLHNGDYRKLTEIEFKILLQFSVDELTPIPLTEEILLKCGVYYDIDSDTFKISNCSLQLDIFDFEEYDCVVFGESLIQIKYLHQLQNLYHALTGQELEIEL